jgi:hypothetical protein
MRPNFSRDGVAVIWEKHFASGSGSTRVRFLSPPAPRASLGRTQVTSTKEFSAGRFFRPVSLLWMQVGGWQRRDQAQCLGEYTCLDVVSDRGSPAL